MGTVSLKAAQVKHLQQYDIIRKDTTRGFTQFVSKPSNQEMLVVELQLGRDFQSLSQMESYLQRSMMLQHQNIVVLRDYYIDQASGSAAGLYEYPLRSLFDEKAQRQMFNTPYKENELWSVVQGLVMGMNYLNKNGVRNQSLRLQTVMLANSGTIKVADPAITNAESNYRLCLSYPGSFFPLAPSQVESLSGGRSRSTLGSSKDDVFCAGVILLELALIGARHVLQPATQQNNYRNSITQGIQVCGERYSSELLMIIGLMLEFSDKERFDWADLVELVDGSRGKMNEQGNRKVVYVAGGDSMARGSFGKPHQPTPTVVVDQSKKILQERTKSPVARHNSHTVDDKLFRHTALHKPKVSLAVVNKPQSNIVSSQQQPPQQRSNQTSSELFFPAKKEEVPDPQSTTIRSNRILASNISRERSLGKSFQNIVADPIRYQQQQANSNKSSIVSNGGLQPLKPVPNIAFTFQQLRQPKPQTASSNFESITEQVKDSQLNADNRFSDGTATPINSIIVQERGFDLLGNRIQRNNQSLTEEDMNIVPKTFADATYTKEQAQTEKPESLFEKKMNTTRSYKDLVKADVIDVEEISREPKPEEIEPPLPTIEVEPVMSYENMQSSLLNSGMNSLPLSKPSIEMTISLPQITTGGLEPALERLRQVNVVAIESKIIEKIPSHSSNGSRQWYQPAEVQTSVRAMSVAYDNMIESKEWNNLFKKGETSKISVEVQTSPIRSNSPEKNRQGRFASSTEVEQAKVSEVRNRNLEESSKTVKATYEQPRYDRSNYEPPREQPPKYEPQPPPRPKTLPHYDGETLRGFRHGFGRYYFEDGGYYEGQWTFNRMQGKGKLYYASGKIAYQGYWSQDQIHGYGKLYNENPRFVESFDYKDFTKLGNYWSTYEGNFEFDQKNGNGTLTLCNGETYSGGFEADHVHNEGVFRGRNRTVHGVWQRGQLKNVL